MIAGYHLIWTAYGWWLPNDPRGSTSHKVRCADIADLGELHYGRKRIQPAGRIVREFYEAARGALKHELLKFSSVEFDAIGAALFDAMKAHRYTCYACAIMPDHVHLLIRKHRDLAETMIDKLQAATRIAILNLGRRAEDHPVWSCGGWKGYLESFEDIQRTVRYIEDNPLRIGLPLQHWPFVTQYDGWLPGQLRAKPQAEQRPHRPGN